MFVCPAHRASAPWSPGQIIPMPCSLAQTLAGSTLSVFRIAPFSPTSPMMTYLPSSCSGKIPIAHRIPHSIGKSKCEPLFSTSAGDRFTVNRFGGIDRFSADRTLRMRSADSLTARSARPIMLNSGLARPVDNCTWTSMRVASIPLNMIEFSEIMFAY